MSTPAQPAARCDCCDWTFGCFDGSTPCFKKTIQPAAMPRETPESDRAKFRCSVSFRGPCDVVIYDFAKKMETELESVRRASQSLYEQDHKKIEQAEYDKRYAEEERRNAINEYLNDKNRIAILEQQRDSARREVEGLKTVHDTRLFAFEEYKKVRDGELTAARACVVEVEMERDMYRKYWAEAQDNLHRAGSAAADQAQLVERLKGALKEAAKQQLTAEMDSDTREHGDFHYAYDVLVKNSREALLAATPAPAKEQT